MWVVIFVFFFCCFNLVQLWRCENERTEKRIKFYLFPLLSFVCMCFRLIYLYIWHRCFVCLRGERYIKTPANNNHNAEIAPHFTSLTFSHSSSCQPQLIAFFFRCIFLFFLFRKCTYFVSLFHNNSFRCHILFRLFCRSFYFWFYSFFYVCLSYHKIHFTMHTHTRMIRNIYLSIHLSYEHVIHWCTQNWTKIKQTLNGSAISRTSNEKLCNKTRFTLHSKEFFLLFSNQFFYGL